MKLKITTPSGQATIGVQTSPPNGGGAMPNGNSVLQILEGWPHGSTAGLGGADWSAGCGVFRGESYRMGPSFGQESGNGDACQAAGIGRLCSPTAPSGVWQLPWNVRIPAAAVPGTGVGRFSLTSPIPARLFALELCITKGPLIPEAIDPCPCDDGCCGCGTCQGVLVRNFKSRLIRQTYPGLGRETAVRIDSAAPIPYDDTEQESNACLFSAQRLLDGQNHLPPWVSNVELMNGNDELEWEIANQSAIFAIEVSMVLHLRYGRFDLQQAVADFCEAKKCGC